MTINSNTHDTMATKKSEDAAAATTVKPDEPKKLKQRKDLPSVQYLLRHGDPETAHLPKTWAETIGYPFALAMVFALSLFLFHNAPWHKLPNRKKYTLPNIKERQAQQKRRTANIPHLNKVDAEL